MFHVKPDGMTELAQPIVMTVRVVGGDRQRVIEALRAAGQHAENSLLGHADTAWSIRAEPAIGECRGGDYCDELCPGAGRCGLDTGRSDGA